MNYEVAFWCAIAALAACVIASSWLISTIVKTNESLKRRVDRLYGELSRRPIGFVESAQYEHNEGVTFTGRIVDPKMRNAIFDMPEVSIGFSMDQDGSIRSVVPIYDKRK